MTLLSGPCEVKKDKRTATAVPDKNEFANSIHFENLERLTLSHELRNCLHLDGIRRRLDFIPVEFDHRLRVQFVERQPEVGHCLHTPDAVVLVALTEDADVLVDLLDGVLADDSLRILKGSRRSWS